MSTGYSIRLLALGLAGTSLLQPLVWAEHSAYFHRRVQVRCALPAGTYGQDTKLQTGSIVSDAGTVEQVLLVLDNPVKTYFPPSYGLSQNAVLPSPDSILLKQSSIANNPKLPLSLTIIGPPRADYDTNVQPVAVRRKSFALNGTKVTAGNVTLDRIALSIYETGAVSFTGLISDSGGADGLTLGSDVNIKVRGYGQRLVSNPVPPNGPLYFETRNSFRVLRGRSDAISLTELKTCDTIREHFDELTHIEVVLESRRSR